MKNKFFCVIAAALLIVGSSTALRADEGMWMLPLLEKMNADALRSLGSRLTPEQIYSINNSSIKDAVVQFGGGCTGEIISSEGLLVTNHHCGYGSIQSLSSPEHNYLEDGYWAMSRAEEIPVPGLTVRFLQRMEDVTDRIAKGESRESIIGKVRDANPNCTFQIASFYNDNVFYLIISKIYRDVRFVGAPPASVGKFGGDTDNWMWPRHTCDFSMFRVYAGKDNEPAEYSADNVPLHPRQNLKVSLRGVQEGDFAMIMGYPGSTQRFQTAAQLESMLALNEIRIAARGVRQDVLWQEMRADDKVGLQYASKYAGSSNGWKKWIGQREAFAKLGIIGKQKAREAELNSWIAARSRRSRKYGSVVDSLASAVEGMLPTRKASILLSETLGNVMLPAAIKNARSEDAFRNFDAAVEKKMAVAVVEHYLANVEPRFRMDISPGQIERMFDETAYSSWEKLQAAKAAGKDLAEDAWVRFSEGVRENSRLILEANPGYEDFGNSLGEYSKTYTAAVMEWTKDAPSYPDANLTCRLTYGTVKGYEPKDGVVYKYYTTLKGVMEKEDPGNYEFRVPARLKEIYETSDYGGYADADGSLHTCFLANLDITGGNSGSPVLDADGALIGLAFDGNWEAMSSDVLFEPELQRCICVDIRYVLLMMDKFGGAGYLLDEMDIVR